MKKLLPLFACIFFFVSGNLHAQDTEPIWLLNPHDSLLLVVENGKKFVLHPVKAKQTLFSISRYYNIGLDELMDYNPTLKEDPTLRTGSRLKIPIPNKAIRRYKGSGFKPVEWVQIYYVVQTGDNLFQISKRYFDMPVDSVSARNHLKNNAIKPGQRLQVGWMGVEGIHSDWRTAKGSGEDGSLKDKYALDKMNRKEVETQGVCFWQKDSKEKSDLYALHRDAAIGTIISVYNPMSNRTVFARVISRIPDGYERNIEVILSPEAAMRLGARDPKFFVKVKYLK